MTHAEYLERYHEESEDVRRTIGTYLARDDFPLAKAELERWDARVDALWAQVQTPA